jgi:formate--tetrahydrofolate ligase
MDMNDRALRRITIDVDGKRDGANRSTGFVITVAAEIMAILALAASRDDLRRRLAAIVIGATRDGKPVRAADLNATGAMMALLADALLPNLVQTTEGTPALVHTGPFGNIAHGTSSIIAQELGLRLADHVVNEAGFAADLGAEKYLDIVMQVSGISPSAAVLVTTVQSLRNQGEGDLERGFPNLARHVQNLRRFGLPTIVAINRFPHDTHAELDQLLAFCEQLGVSAALTEPFTKGGEGSEELAKALIALIGRNPLASAHPVYALSDSYEEKLEKVATQIYGATGVSLSETAHNKLRQLGLQRPPHLHRQNAILLLRRSEEARSAHRLDAPHHRCLSLCRSRLPRPHRRQHDAHAWPPQSLPRRGNRRRRRRRNHRRLDTVRMLILIGPAFGAIRGTSRDSAIQHNQPRL